MTESFDISFDHPNELFIFTPVWPIPAPGGLARPLDWAASSLDAVEAEDDC
jgi:hypothetical protein